ncbi:MAG: amino acid decarboxylase [Acidobacteriia bacterium]|nr:amino acid decarboxylase [Terriglobia bacterium]
MTPEEFRRFGHEVVDWIADYSDRIREYPVLSRNRPGDLTRALPPSAPETGEPMEAILSDFRDLIVPAITHWNHPAFLGYFGISGSEPGILGEMLAAGLNVNGMLWKSSPAVTELEQVTLGWLRQWLGLPKDFFGVIYDTASTSTLHAVVAARQMAVAPEMARGNWEHLVLYCSEQAHSSVEKAAVTAGIGRCNVRTIAVDENFRLRPELLSSAIEDDLRAGMQPFCVVATVGTTAMASTDPVEQIADIAARHGIWLHVDAAYGGSAAILPEMAHVMNGCARAHSLVVNPHKWLLTPVDLSVFYTSRPDLLRRAFSLVPEYLRTGDGPEAINLMDYGFQLGRRFRALKLWFVMRNYGREGLAAIIRGHLDLAQEFAGWVKNDDRFELCAPVDFSLVCFRYRGTDADNQKLLDAINRSGAALLSHAVFGGRMVLRVAIGNYRTQREDLRRVWDCIGVLAGKLG